MILRFGVITASDRSARGERPDMSGPALTELIEAQGWTVTKRTILPDELDLIATTLSEWADSGECDVILVTGGTGFSQRDVTPEATKAVIDRDAPGLAEAMRSESLKVTPHAMLSRSVAGIRGEVIIINLPGSPNAATENARVVIPVLPHAVELCRGSQNSESHHALS